MRRPKVPCKGDGCTALVRDDSPSGYCRVCGNTAHPSTEQGCAGRVATWSKGKRCREHYRISQKLARNRMDLW